MIYSASILIVDDTPTNLRVLVEAFETTGFESFVAKSGESALKKARQSLPDLILLDICMKGMDGFETCQALKSDPLTRSIPVIFMTALNDDAIKLRGFEVGAVDYITKPIQLEEAIARISVHLQLRQSHQQLLNEISTRQETEAQLQQTLRSLQQTQVQLIQAEKLAGLGQMMAGIAHEINNPINFIYGNLEHLRVYTSSLLQLVDSYTQHYSNPPDNIRQLIATIDLSFIQDDLPDLVNSIELGTVRTQEIIQSLQIFSRAGEVGTKRVDIHEGIDSTLLLLGHRLSASLTRTKIKLNKNFGLNSPIECFPVFLNQVLMNLIVNAIDAIDEKALTLDAFRDESPTVTITTNQIDEKIICIEIEDNGVGVPQSIKEKLFDPFFTTKPVGQGTGLGLSICHEIITNRHQGTIHYEISPSGGSVFSVTIPLVQSDVQEPSVVGSDHSLSSNP